MADTLRDDLLRHLYLMFSEGPREGACWVMNAEWFTEIRLLAPPHGGTLWEPTPDADTLLLGIPVLVRDDGGPPHLEPLPLPPSSPSDGRLAYFRRVRRAS